jgi:hypothetical protein
VSAAVEALGQRDKDFTWQAILGPLRRLGGALVSSPLAKQEMLGPVQLTPGGVQMRELIRESPYLIDPPGWQLESWPIIASGVVRTYSLAGADAAVRCAVHRTCALLSLFWEKDYWLLRSGPRVTAPGRPAGRLLSVPQSVGPWKSLPGNHGRLPGDFNTYKGHDLLTLPAWAPAAWAVLDDDTVLNKAIQAYYEARSLEMDHPSAAFLFFVATIEGVGARLTDQTGARQRFRAALKTALADDTQVRKLVESAYPIRSQTGHDGSLFGAESTRGKDFQPFELKPAWVFELYDVGEIREASRKVLTKEIQRVAAGRAAVGSGTDC